MRNLSLVFLLGLCITVPCFGDGPKGKIVFVTGDMRLATIDPDGSNLQEIPLLPDQFKYMSSPQWSPDGSLIAFRAIRPSWSSSEIFISTSLGTSLMRISDGTQRFDSPSFSPNGDRIAYNRASGHLYIFRFDNLSIDERDVLAGHPRWSPAGDYITYTDWGSTYDSSIFLYFLDTGEKHPLKPYSEGKAYNYAAWSPNGKKLAVNQLDRSTAKYDIWIMDVDVEQKCVSNEWNLTEDWPSSSESWPSWSADGEYIVFVSDFEGNNDIFYAPAHEDSVFAPVNITKSPENEHQPAISKPQTVLVVIDIKPGSYPNSINLGSHGLVPVAILSSPDFDATTVDPETVELAGVAVAVRGKSNKYMAASEDVNGDGLIDLMVHVATENLDPGAFQDGLAILTANTFDGQAIEGEDEITVVPPSK